MQMAHMNGVHMPYGNLPHVPESFWVVFKGELDVQEPRQGIKRGS